MRLVIELLNGCVSYLAVEEPCEVLIIDRDQCADQYLPDGERGYMGQWDVPADKHSVQASFKFARLPSS